jgi:hypothetical protein
VLMVKRIQNCRGGNQNIAEFFHKIHVQRSYSRTSSS